MEVQYESRAQTEQLVNKLLMQGVLTQEFSPQGTFMGYKDRTGTFYDTEETIAHWLG